MDSELSRRPPKTPVPDDHSPAVLFKPFQVPLDGPMSLNSIESVGLNVVIDRADASSTDHPAQGDVRVTRSGDSDRSLGRGGRSRSSLVLLWLMSYASAVTLALIWILSTGRTLFPAQRTVDELLPPPQTSTSSLMTKESPPVPLPPENLIPLGRSILLGSVEVTPLGIERHFLRLAHSIDPEQSRQERAPSLVLRLKITNLSSDQPISPLEKFSVRDCPGVPTETFLQTECSRITMYPLALESEWQVEGQGFPTLRPGEAAETLLATSPFSAKRLSDTMTWHVRLRVTPHQTNVFGVIFSIDDIVDR